MDLKAIEAALVRATEADCFSSALPTEANEANDELVAIHGPDLLRLVRAMAWMQKNLATVGTFDGAEWIVTMWNVDEYRGRTPLDAIEAAIQADQQTKGATDGQA